MAYLIFRLYIPIHWIPAGMTLILYALTAVDEHNLSFWDAVLWSGLVWSVAQEYKVTELYSEDFQAGRELKGVTL